MPRRIFDRNFLKVFSVTDFLVHTNLHIYSIGKRWTEKSTGIHPKSQFDSSLAFVWLPQSFITAISRPTPENVPLRQLGLYFVIHHLAWSLKRSFYSQLSKSNFCGFKPNCIAAYNKTVCSTERIHLVDIKAFLYNSASNWLLITYLIDAS